MSRVWVTLALTQKSIWGCEYVWDTVDVREGECDCLNIWGFTGAGSGLV